MKKIKALILSLFDRISIHSDFYQRFEALSRKQQYLSRLNHLFAPDVLPLEKIALPMFKEIPNGLRYENCELAISKNDIMFLFWLYHCDSLEHALKGYYSSGIMQADIIKSLFLDQGLDLENTKLLDFASGHGRVSRYFSKYLDVKNIYVSDIKLGAVKFQQDKFNYNGLVAPADPLLFETNVKFDSIVVSSLFTHLNRELFSRWLFALGRQLNLGGILSISIHKIDSEMVVFEYSEFSEEDLFMETDDNLSGLKIYGVTHLSLAALNDILSDDSSLKFDIVDTRNWGESQVLISLIRMS